MEKKEVLKLAIIGYGKMGKIIEKLSKNKGFEIGAIIKTPDELFLKKDSLLASDVAIEFTKPSAAFQNVKFCLENGLPIVSGTTAWNDQLEEAKNLSKSLNVSFFHANNFSLGVHYFFQANKMLAKGLNDLEYQIEIEEIHHTEKKDAPSGTAIAAAEIIINEQSQYDGWTNESKEENKIAINSQRVEDVKGTHTIKFVSEIDEISITHRAFTRNGFAEGALMAARYVVKNKGCFNMDDLTKTFS